MEDVKINAYSVLCQYPMVIKVVTVVVKTLYSCEYIRSFYLRHLSFSVCSYRAFGILALSADVNGRLDNPSFSTSKTPLTSFIKSSYEQ